MKFFKLYLFSLFFLIFFSNAWAVDRWQITIENRSTDYMTCSASDLNNQKEMGSGDPCVFTYVPGFPKNAKLQLALLACNADNPRNVHFYCMNTMTIKDSYNTKNDSTWVWNGTTLSCKDGDGC